jgi:hypothetical protein
MRKGVAMTKREYLSQLGFLVGARGRFTREQIEALKQAEAQGKVFAKPNRHPHYNLIEWVVMKKSIEQKAVEQLSNAISDIRFEDSLFAMELQKQPPKVQRKMMKLFLTVCKFWGIDWKFDNHINKDMEVVQIAESISAHYGEALEECQSPVVEWYQTKQEEAVNLDEYR